MFAHSGIVIMALALVPPVTSAVKPPVRHVTLKGKFVVSEEAGDVVFKAGSKKLVIDLAKVRLQKHSVKKLKDLPVGTGMVLFAKFTPWADGDEFERMACLVAGRHYIPEHVPASENVATWHGGRLHFNSNKTIAYVDGTTLPTGVDRATCVIEAAKVEDFFQTKKSGKKTAKPAFARGVYTEVKVNGKKKKVFSPKVITLPTRGIPKKEYQYILDPARMYKDLGG